MPNYTWRIPLPIEWLMSDALQPLADAVARNAAIKILLPATSDAPLRSRLLGADSSTVWVEAPSKQDLLIDTLRRSGKPAAVSFRSGVNLVEFESAIVGVSGSYRVSPTLVAAALGLALPTALKVAQRRSAFRVRVPLNTPVRAELLQEAARTPRAVELRELSTGGATLLVPRTATTCSIPIASAVVVVLKERDRRTPIPGRVVRLEDVSGGATRVSVAFDDLAKTFEGRRVAMQLSQWVAGFQRVFNQRQAG